MINSRYKLNGGTALPGVCDWRNSEVVRVSLPPRGFGAEKTEARLIGCPPRGSRLQAQNAATRSRHHQAASEPIA